MLHIKTTNGEDTWLNPAHIVSIEPEKTGSAIRTTGNRPFGNGSVGPLEYHTAETPTDLLVRLRVESGGAK